MEKYGVRLKEVEITFLYRVNMAIAILIVVINVQNFAGAVLAEDAPQNAVLITGLMLFASLAYGFFALNGILSKIVIYTEGMLISSLIRRNFIASNEIKNVTFQRKDTTRMRINLELFDKKNVVINTAKYKNPDIIIEFCRKFKNNE